MAKSLMLALATVLIGSAFFTASTEANQNVKVQNMKKVKFTIGKNVAVATLYDTPASRDFIAQLPLKLSFEDFAGKAKISYPPKKLSSKQDSKSPSEGDFAYYAPWGNIAIFYKGNADATSDLLILGKFDSGKEFFKISGTFEGKIELAE